MAKKTKNVQISRRLSRKAVVTLLLVVFAAIASYLLITSYAAIPDNDFRGSGGLVADYSIYSDNENPNEQHAVGSTFTRNYYLYFPAGGTYPQGPHHLQFYLRWYSNELKNLPAQFNCGTATPCVMVSTPGYSERSPVTNLIYCFDITPEMRNQGNVRLFSTGFQQLSATQQNWVDDILYLFSGECSGYYENGPPANDPNYLAFSSLGNGSLGSGIAVQQEGAANGGDKIVGSGGQGGGSDMNGTGSGGGSSGSAATIVNNQPNNTPSSSSQGDNPQSKMNPSPFFDGKEYKPGSDADGFGSAVSKVGKHFFSGLSLFVSVLVLMSVLGCGYWFWKRKRG